MDTTTVVVSLSPDVENVLLDNDVDLIKVLQQERLAIGRAPRPADLEPMQPGAKSAELIILVTAAAAPVIASAIVRVIDALSRNKRAVVRDLPSADGASKRTTGLASKHTVKLSFLGFRLELSDEYKT